MITPIFILFLLLGTLAMLVPMVIVAYFYNIKIYKSVPIAIVLTLTGTAGTYLLGFIESHLKYFTRSFYGAVFFVPMVFMLFARLVCIDYGRLMDMCAPAICMMLVLMKALCYFEGCCGGCALYANPLGEIVYFPSQIVELINALVLMVVLIMMAYKGKSVGRVYPYFLILYGISRFVLNFFRGDNSSFLWILPAGHFWSLIAIIIGIAWMQIQNRNKTFNA